MGARIVGWRIVDDYGSDARTGSHDTTRDEARALQYIAHLPTPGSVLANPRLGALIPAVTGRMTWVGHSVWTPAFSARTAQVTALLSGRLSQTAAAQLVTAAHVRFVLAGCDADVNALSQLWSNAAVESRRFGCAVVYRWLNRPLTGAG